MNDDLAACGPVVSRESVIVARESITVIDVLKNIFSFSNTIVHNETRTSKNDAFRPFASFYSLCKRIYQSIFGSVELSETRKLVPVKIPIIEKTFKQ